MDIRRSTADYHQSMIGLPSTYRPQQQQRQQPAISDETYEAYMNQAVPSSTVPSAAHSQRTDHTGYVFEPSGDARSYPSFAALGNEGSQQQVPGEFVPGAGGGTAEYYAQRQVPQRTTTRSSTNVSGYSDSSPVRSNGPNPGGHGSPLGAGLFYPNNRMGYSSGSDPFPSSDQYTSPPQSPEKYVQSPEQIHRPNPPHQGAFPFTQPFTYGPEPNTFPSPQRSQRGASGWQSVDNTAAIAPGAASAITTGSGSSGGGGSANGPFSSYSSVGGGAGYSSSPNPRFAPQKPATVGRSHSINGSGHVHSQSASGHLAPPTSTRRPAKRAHHERDGDSEGEEEEEEEVARPRGTKRL